jgi:hypothetical protein
MTFVCHCCLTNKSENYRRTKQFNYSQSQYEQLYGVNGIGPLCKDCFTLFQYFKKASSIKSIPDEKIHQVSDIRTKHNQRNMTVAHLMKIFDHLRENRNNNVIESKQTSEETQQSYNNDQLNGENCIMSINMFKSLVENIPCECTSLQKEYKIKSVGEVVEIRGKCKDCGKQFKYASSDYLDGTQQYIANKQCVTASQLSGDSYYSYELRSTLAGIHPVSSRVYNDTAKAMWPKAVVMARCVEQECLDKYAKALHERIQLRAQSLVRMEYEDKQNSNIWNYVKDEYLLPIELCREIYEYMFDAYYVNIIFDGQYVSSGWHSLEMNMGFFETDVLPGNILFHTTQMKQRNRDRSKDESWTENEVIAASCELEGLGLQDNLFQMFKSTTHDLPVRLASYTHDKDGKAKSIIDKYCRRGIVEFIEVVKDVDGDEEKIVQKFDESKRLLLPVENLCLNHTKKALLAKVEASVGITFTGIVKHDVNWALKHFDGTANDFKKVFMNTLEHRSGNHTGCGKECYKSSSVTLDKGSSTMMEKYNKLKIIYEDLCLYAYKIIRKRSVNICEAWHRSLKMLVPKDRDFWKTLKARVAATVCRKNLGENWVTEFYNNYLNLPLSGSSVTRLDRMDNRRENQKEYKKRPEVKANRISNTQALAKLHNKTESDRTYYPKDAAQKQKQLLQLASKGDTKKNADPTTTTCGCRSKCTGVCSCSGIGCSNLCGCVYVESGFNPPNCHNRPRRKLNAQTVKQKRSEHKQTTNVKNAVKKSTTGAKRPRQSSKNNTSNKRRKTDGVGPQRRSARLKNKHVDVYESDSEDASQQSDETIDSSQFEICCICNTQLSDDFCTCIHCHKNCCLSDECSIPHIDKREGKSPLDARLCSNCFDLYSSKH